MNAFLLHSLPIFAKRNPFIEITVAPQPNTHPVIIGHYTNGNRKEVCVKNMTNEQVRVEAERLRDTTGEKERRNGSVGGGRDGRGGRGGIGRPVTSLNESVRGIWSPFHGGRVKI